MASKYDGLKPQVEQLLDQGQTVTEICEQLNIPVGSITYLLKRWGLLDKQIRRTGRYSAETMAKWSQTMSKTQADGKCSGKTHRLYKKRKVRGKWVTSDEARIELSSLVEKDLTISQMNEIMGTTRVKGWLKEFDLQRGIRSGDRCSWWRGGHEKYRGPGWLSVREEVLERDDFQCKHCGLTEKEALERGHGLNVHHVDPYAESQDNSLDNLITLCQSCHLKLEWKTGRLS